MPLEPPDTLLKLTDEEFHSLSRFVYREYGIDLSKKRRLIEGRLSNVLKAKGLTSFSAYLRILTRDKSGQEVHTFLNKITTNYSYFARESDHFQFLMDTVLPALERQKKYDIRIWSAGCSSGQEPYNIAMAIDQYFGSKKGQFDTTILATDISTNVLEKAATAIYPAADLEGLPDTWVRKYFTAQPEGRYQVVERMRKEVVFRSFNLMDSFVYKKPFDIIFCRNVMIYFDGETTQRLVDKFYSATQPGGYLFIGHSEYLDKRTTPYRNVKPAVYQKPLLI